MAGIGRGEGKPASAPRRAAAKGGVVNDDLHEILRALGRIEGQMDGIKNEIITIKGEQGDGRESRLRIHEKLEKLVEDVHIVGQVAAQARDKADAVGKVLTEEVKPVTDDIKRLRLMGAGFSVAVGLAAGSLGVGIATWGGNFLDWLRSLGRS